MRQVITTLICVIFLSSAGTSQERKSHPTGRSVNEAKQDIRAILIRGKAFVLHPGSSAKFPMTEKQSVGTKDKIITEENTRVELQFPDGSVFRINSNTMLLLRNAGVQLQLGEAWFNLQEQGSIRQVTSPTAVCEGSGTEFILKVDKSSSTAYLINGRLSVSDNTGKKVTLETGQAVKSTTVGIGSVVGFDNKEVIGSFEGEGKTGGNTEITVNTMLILGSVLAATIVLLINFSLRKRKKAGKVSAFPSPDPTKIPDIQQKNFNQFPFQTTPDIQPHPEKKAAFCGSCGTRLVEGARFCTVCGAKV